MSADAFDGSYMQPRCIQMVRNYTEPHCVWPSAESTNRAPNAVRLTLSSIDGLSPGAFLHAPRLQDLKSGLAGDTAQPHKASCISRLNAR